jgi:hypothetical protein
MAEAEFESRLLRLFDQPPAMPDGDAFALRVEARLDRGWGLRQVLIWTAGIAGGVIGAVQMVGSGLLPQFETATEESSLALSRHFETFMRSGADYAALPLNGEVLWMAAALGVMALAFAITRAVEEF